MAGTVPHPLTQDDARVTSNLCLPRRLQRGPQFETADRDFDDASCRRHCARTTCDQARHEPSSESPVAMMPITPTSAGWCRSSPGRDLEEDRGHGPHQALQLFNSLVLFMRAGILSS